MTLLEVADLSDVWVEADVYEKDSAFLQPGQKVEASVEAMPGRTFAGKIALVYPRLDAATRTNRVRFEVQNPGPELRPGMFATVTLSTSLDAVEPFRTMVSRSGQKDPRACARVSSSSVVIAGRLLPPGQNWPTRASAAASANVYARLPYEEPGKYLYRCAARSATACVSTNVSGTGIPAA